MLDFLSGASRSQQDKDHDPEEMPETPAHIFAARAFKSLLFGTPAPQDMTTEKPKRFSRLSQLKNSPRRHSTDVVSEDNTRPLMQPRHSDPMASPSKGILVAPGSISTKRKSVTFDGLVRDFQAPDAKENSRPPSLSDLLVPSLAQASQPEPQQDDIRRSLFQTRSNSQDVVPAEEKPPSEDFTSTTDNDNKCIVLDAPVSVQKAPPQPIPARQSSKQNEDQTVDLNKPRSTSGQHWKREYERDHDNSKSEMKKLIQYNQMTKSYAEKRDRDATIMVQKLNDAETKAKSMEKKIQKLAAQLVDASTEGDDQDAILGKVASQTAEVLKYKSRAARYREALRKHESLQSSTDDEDRQTTSRRSSMDFESELETLKAAARNAEARAARLSKENASLRSMLEEMKNKKTAQEQRYNDLHDQLQKKDGRIWEDNQRLATELRTTKSENASMREELRSLKEAARAVANHRHQNAKDRLFDLSRSRLTKEPSPPASDEELRQKAAISFRRVEPATMPHMDFTLSKNEDKKRSKVDVGKSRRRQSYAGELSDTLSLPELDTSMLQAPSRVPPPLERRSTAPADYDLDQSPQKAQIAESLHDPNSGVLMKSFIDNLGTRRALPPDRIAAAKKRLEEKAANRRATPKYERAQQKALAQV